MVAGFRRNNETREDDERSGSRSDSEEDDGFFLTAGLTARSGSSQPLTDPSIDIASTHRVAERGPSRVSGRGGGWPYKRSRETLRKLFKSAVAMVMKQAMDFQTQWERKQFPSEPLSFARAAVVLLRAKRISVAPTLCFHAHNKHVSGLSFVHHSEDKQGYPRPCLLTWSNDGMVCLWNAKTGAKLCWLYQGNNRTKKPRKHSWRFYPEIDKHHNEHMANIRKMRRTGPLNPPPVHETRIAKQKKRVKKVAKKPGLRNLQRGLRPVAEIELDPKRHGPLAPALVPTRSASELALGGVTLFGEDLDDLHLSGSDDSQKDSESEEPEAPTETTMNPIELPNRGSLYPDPSPGVTKDLAKGILRAGAKTKKVRLTTRARLRAQRLEERVQSFMQTIQKTGGPDMPAQVSVSDSPTQGNSPPSMRSRTVPWALLAQRHIDDIGPPPPEKVHIGILDPLRRSPSPPSWSKEQRKQKRGMASSQSLPNLPMMTGSIRKGAKKKNLGASARFGATLPGL